MHRPSRSRGHWRSLHLLSECQSEQTLRGGGLGAAGGPMYGYPNVNTGSRLSLREHFLSTCPPQATGPDLLRGELKTVVWHLSFAKTKGGYEKQTELRKVNWLWMWAVLEQGDVCVYLLGTISLFWSLKAQCPLCISAEKVINVITNHVLHIEKVVSFTEISFITAL